MHKKIALCGFYGKHNFGDDLMAHHLAEILSVNEHDVQVFSDKADVGIVNGLATGLHLQQDVIVIGGGGIVSPGFWVFKGDGLEKLKKSGKAVCFVNVNVTPDYMSDEAFCEALKSLQARWWVRNEQSVRLLAEKGIDSTFVPDISFREGIVPARKEETETKKLAVFLNSYVLNDISSHADVDKFIRALHGVRAISSYLDWMSNFGWEVTFYAAQTAREVDDRIPSGLVFNSMKKKTKATWRAEADDWSSLIQAISQSDLVLSMRYHSTTVALASGVPCVDITHHAKNLSLINELELQKTSVLYQHLHQDDLIEATINAERVSDYTERVSIYRAAAQVRWKMFDEGWADYLRGL